MLKLLGILKHWKHAHKAYKPADSLDPQDIMRSSPQSHAAPKLELLQGQAKIRFPVRLILQRQGMCSRSIHDLFFSRQGIANSRGLIYVLTQDSRLSYRQLWSIHPLLSIGCSKYRSRPLENNHLPIVILIPPSIGIHHPRFCLLDMYETQYRVRRPLVFLTYVLRKHFAFWNIFVFTLCR